MAEITAKNKLLAEPLQKAQEEVEELKKELSSYEKDKETLRVIALQLFSEFTFFYTPPYDGVRVLWYHIGCRCVCPYFRFWKITWVNIKGFSLNLVCALILWRSGLGLLMRKFHQFLTELPASIRILVQDNNLSKSEWISTKFDICIDIVEIWVWDYSANFVYFDNYLQHDNGVGGGGGWYYHFTFLFRTCVKSPENKILHLLSIIDLT